MATATPPTDPDSLAVLHALEREGLSAKDIYNALGGLRNMSGQNVIAAIEALNARFEASIETQNARFEASIKTQNARFEASIESQNAKLDAISAAQESRSAAQESRLRMLMWMIGASVAVIGILVRLGN